MKDIWSGSISFGLVNIPVRLYSAVQSHGIGFKLLERESKTPIHYQRWCPVCKHEVAWRDVVKGLEVGKDRYVILTKEELVKLRPAKTETIDVLEFVDWPIDTIYLDSHYYLAPEKPKQKAYFLFREVLMLTGKAAIGRFVMKEKEHVCAITSYKRGLLLTTLNYEYEIRDIDDIEQLKEPAKTGKEEIELARQMLDKIYVKRFDMSQFKDTFAEELKKALKKREQGIEVEVEKPAKKETKGKELINALKESLK